MGGGSSPNTWRTLQRSPTRKSHTYEDTYPALETQVLDVMKELDDYRRKCELEGNYMEARAAAQRLHGVKVFEDNKRKAAMDERHAKERERAEKAYKSEIDERNRLWDEKLQNFHKGVVEHAAKLKRQQISILQNFRGRMASNTPCKPQWSRELLKYRKVQQFLAKQGKYLEAQDIKKIGDRMEHNELQETLATYQAEVALKEQALRAKQQIEMEVLLQRAAQGRDELRKTRVLDIERCHQRHKNIVRELKAIHRTENIRFDVILGKKIHAFKQNGGSFELLDQTINGYSSLCLPSITDVGSGDACSIYDSETM